MKNYFIFQILLTFISVSAQEKTELIMPLGHTRYINVLSISSDGRYLLSGSSDMTIKLWDVKSGREIRTFSGHNGLVVGIVFDPNNVNFYSCGWDAKIIKWHIMNDKPIVVMENHGEEVNSIAISLDGKYLATGNWRNGTIKLWNPSNGLLIKKFEGHTGGINSLTISDSGYLYSASNDKTIKQWTIPDAELINTFEGNPSVTISMKVLTDGSIISFNFDHLVRIWEKEQVKEPLIFTDFSNKRTTSSSLHIDITKDEKYILFQGADFLTVYERSNKKKVYYYTLYGSGSFNDAKFVPYHNFIVYTSSKGSKKTELDGINVDLTLIQWDRTENNGLTRRFNNGTTSAINTFDFSENNLKIVTASPENISVWYLPMARFIQSIPKASRDLCMFPDGKRLVTVGNYSSILVYNLENGKEITSIPEQSDLTKISLSKDEMFLARSGYKSGIAIYKKNLSTSTYVPYKLSLSNTENPVFSNNNLNLAVKNGFEVRMYHVDSLNVAGYKGKLVHKHDHFPYSIVFSPDDRFVCSGSLDKTIKLTNLSNGQTVTTIHGFTNNSTVLSVALSPDGKRLLSCDGGGIIKLWNIPESGEHLEAYQTLSGHLKGITHAEFIDSGKRIITSSYDGTIRVWDVAQGKELVRLISFNDGINWIAATPDGYYTASKGANNYIHYVQGIKVFTFDQFDLQYNRPDIILKRLGYSSIDLIQSYYKAYEKRLRKMGFNPNNFEKERSFNAPEIMLPESDQWFVETSQPNYTLTCSAIDKLYNIERLFIEVNGVPLFGYKGKMLDKNSGKKVSIHENIPLGNGKNIIKISVLNEKGVESLAERIEVIYTPTAPVSPNLHVIAIGVSKFKDSEYNLTYADKDAQDIVTLMESAKSRYANIRIHKFFNEKATRQNILSIRSELERTGVDDQVVVFIATHGVLDDELDYYLAMHDMDFTNPRLGGLRYDELEALLDGIPARNKLVLIDACHSGEVDKEESQLAEAKEPTGLVKTRAFKKVVRDKEGIGLQSSFELMKELFADLRRNNGSVVISSAGGKEYAFESGQWKNGVFTYAVLEGLKNGTADKDKNQMITVSELRDYVGLRVQELTAGKQNPTSRTENLENDFRVW